MLRQMSVSCMLAVVLALVQFPAAVADAAPVAAYARGPEARLVDISPAGTRLALVTEDAAGAQVQVRSLPDLKVLMYSLLKNARPSGLVWIDDDRLLYSAQLLTAVETYDGPRRWFSVAGVIDVPKRNTKALLKDAPGSYANTIVGVPQARLIDGKPMLFVAGWSFQGGGKGIVTLYRQSAGLGGPVVVETGAFNTVGFAVDRAGRAVGRLDLNSRTGAWSLWARPGGGRWREAMTGQGDAPSLIGVEHGGGALIVCNCGEGRYLSVPLDGSPPRPYLVEGAEVASVCIDALTGEPLSVHVKQQGGAPRYVLFDPAAQQNWARAERAFKPEKATVLAWTPRFGAALLSVEGSKSGVGLYYLNMATRRAELIGDRYRDITSADVGPTTSLPFDRAGRGMGSANLVLPRERSANRLPLAVILPSPAEDLATGFDPLPQALASLGYAVVSLPAAEIGGVGQGGWVKAMLADTVAAVEALDRVGTIDRSRVCVVGTGLGGLAALQAVSQSPSPFRCAVAIDAPSDLSAMTRDMDSYQGAFAGSWRKSALRSLGVRGVDDPAAEALSPGRHVERLAAPVLLIHARKNPYFCSSVARRWRRRRPRQASRCSSWRWRASLAAIRCEPRSSRRSPTSSREGCRRPSDARALRAGPCAASRYNGGWSEEARPYG